MFFLWSATMLADYIRSRRAEFQLTRSRGARRGDYVATNLQVKFQLTRSRGARRRFRGDGRAIIGFQLTRSRGARPENSRKQKIFVNYFNSRAHVERDRHRAAEIFDCEANFNSRAHVERDMDSLTGAQKQYISTHALTWSATGFSSLF